MQESRSTGGASTAATRPRPRPASAPTAHACGCALRGGWLMLVASTLRTPVRAADGGRGSDRTGA